LGDRDDTKLSEKPLSREHGGDRISDSDVRKRSTGLKLEHQAAMVNVESDFCND